MGGLCSCFLVSHGEASACWCPKCFLQKMLNKFRCGNRQVRRQMSFVSSGNHSSRPSNSSNMATSYTIEILQVEGHEGRERVGCSRRSVKCIVGSTRLSPPFVDSTPFSDDEDVCPTCLEEYTLENPKIIAKCSHHYHLSCIYEWMERSKYCPACNKLMVFEE